MSASESTYKKTVVVVVAALLCCSISVPASTPWLAPVRALLGSLPLISTVSEVSTHTLTQVRFSYLSLFLVWGTIILAANLVASRRLMKSAKFPAPVICLIVFALVGLLSAIFYGDTVDAVKLMLFLLLGLSIAYSTDEERVGMADSLVRLLMFAGIVNACATIAQFLILTNGSLDFSALRSVRPDGLYGDSIISSIVSVMTAVAVVIYGNSKPFVKTLTVLLLFMAGVVTGSRTFYYLASVAIVLLLVFFAKGGGTKVLVIGSFAAIFGVFAVVFADQISQVMDTLSSASSNVESGRDLKAQLASQLFIENPILGVGTGQYAANEASFFGSMLGTSGINGTNPHNIYLQVLCENGLLGAAPFFAFLCTSIAGLWRNKSLFGLVIITLFLIAGATLGVLYSMSIAPYVVTLVLVLSTKGDRAIGRADAGWA